MCLYSDHATCKRYFSCHFLFISTNSVPWRFGSLHLGRNRWHHHPQHNSNSGQLFVSISLSIICANFLVSGTSNFPLFFPLNFTFNNNRRQQTVDVVEHGWLELNQGTRNMIQLNVSDLVYSNQHISNMFCLKIKRY